MRQGSNRHNAVTYFTYELRTTTPKIEYYYYYTTTRYNDHYSIVTNSWRLSHVRAMRVKTKAANTLLNSNSSRGKGRIRSQTIVYNEHVFAVPSPLLPSSTAIIYYCKAPRKYYQTDLIYQYSRHHEALRSATPCLCRCCEPGTIASPPEILNY